MKNNIKFLGLFLAALVLLPSCMRVPSYSRRPLKSVSADFAYRGVEKNVIVQAKRLTEDDMQYLFGLRGQHMNDSLDVLYFSVHNLSNASYTLSLTDIDLVMVPYNDVTLLMKTNSVGRLAGGIATGGGAAASLYGATMCVLFGKVAAGSIVFSVAPVGFLLLGIASAGASLVFFGKAIKSMVINGKISSDLTDKMFHKNVTINSGQQYDGLVFVKKQDYTPTFSVKMHEQDNINNSITFNVDLHEQQ